MIIYRDFLKENFICLITIFLVVAAIICTNEFSLYLNQAAKGNLTLSAVFKLMLLQFPMMFAYMLPQSYYLGLLLVLARRYADSEMTVLYSSGVSYFKVLMMSLSLALIMILLSTWLMFVVDPKVEGAENYIRLSTVAEMSIDKLIPGQFRSIGDGRVIYAAHRSHVAHTVLKDGVFFAEENGLNQQGQEKWNIFYSDSASQENYKNLLLPFFVFHHGYLFKVAAGDLDAVSMSFDDYGIKMLSQAKQINIWPTDASFSQLWKAKGHDLRAMASLQWRLSMPISIFILTLWALPLSYTKPRKGKLVVLIPALILYLGYVELLFMMHASIAAGKISPYLGVWWVHGVALLVAAALWILRFGYWRIGARRKCQA